MTQSFHREEDLIEIAAELKPSRNLDQWRTAPVPRPGVVPGLRARFGTLATPLASAAAAVLIVAISAIGFSRHSVPSGGAASRPPIVQSLTPLATKPPAATASPTAGVQSPVAKPTNPVPQATAPPAASLQPTPPQHVTLVGSSDVQSVIDNNDPGSAQAYHYTAASDGTITAISVYIAPGSTGAKVEVGIYSDSSGDPGTLLTSAVFVNPPQVGWVSAAVSPITVHAGQDYWFAILQPAGTSGLIQYYDVNGTGTQAPMSASTTLTQLPATWSSGPWWPAGPASMYATGSAT